MSTLTLCSQNTEFQTSVSTGLFYGDSELPYWFYTNQNGRLDAETNFLGLGEQELNFKLGEKSKIELKGGLLYSDGVNDDFIIDQLYARFTNSWLKVSVGVFHEEEALDGLSSTNQNIIWSANARSVPGILIEANEPISIFKGVSLDWGFGHYELNDERDVDGANIHYKRLGAKFQFNENNAFTFELQHYAQWAGTSPVFGELPSGFSDYVDIIFASRSGDENAPDGEQINALGNHLGSYNLTYEGKIGAHSFQLYHQHLFEDGSGTAWKNFPDGLYGAYINLENSILKSVLYEYVHTIYQNGTGTRTGNDNYFNNGIYRSGWRYQGNTLGVPFLIPAQIGVSPGTSRVRAHHIGLTATYKKFDFTLKTSYVQSLGTYPNPIVPKLESVYTFGSMTYSSSNYGKFTLLTGFDAISGGVDSRYGLGIQYKYAF